ncbi:ATP-binding protein, partial [Methylobacterium sp. WL122]
PDLLAGLAASFTPFAARKDLRLLVRSPDLAVSSDGLLLRRILQNLLSNAIRYTASGGVALVARRRAGAVRIDVMDSGCGIAADEHALVFDEFYRGSAAAGDSGGAEADGPGLGLGLSIVRRMALALDHPLALASRPGHGTRVSLTVPESDAPAGAEA